MLQRVANVIIGGMFLLLGSYVLLLHLSTGEPLQVLAVLLGCVLLVIALACFKFGLAAEAGDLRPLSPRAGHAAAQRLLALKKSEAGARWRGFGRVRRLAEVPPHASTRA